MKSLRNYIERNSLMIFLLIVSISAVLNRFITGLSILLETLLFLMAVKIYWNKRYGTKILIYTFLALTGIITSNILRGEFVIGSFLLSITKFILIPIIILNNIQLNSVQKTLDTLYPYFFINIAIVYVRAFYDYTFFGFVEPINFEDFKESYSLGEILWRPSNLAGPIVFSIEIALFLVIQYFKSAKRKTYWILAVSSIMPLIFMQSRSSYLIIILSIISSVLYFKKSGWLTVIVISASVVMFKSEKITESIVALLTLKENSFQSRFQSLFDSIDQFSSYNYLEWLIGKGSGYANLDISNSGSFGIYVENYHMAILHDHGIVIFGIWIIFNTILITWFLGKNSTFIYGITLIGLMLVNSFSSNLSTFPVQIFYWIIITKAFTINYAHKELIHINS